MLVAKLYLENLLSVDKLHYKEVKILNDLHDLVLKKKRKKINKKLDELVLDVEKHFESEERRMFKYKYPWANKHQYAHTCSLQKLYEAQKQWKKDKKIPILKEYLEKIFTPWLNGHIMSMDKIACEYLVKAWSN